MGVVYDSAHTQLDANRHTVPDTALNIEKSQLPGAVKERCAIRILYFYEAPVP